MIGRGVRAARVPSLAVAAVIALTVSLAVGGTPAAGGPVRHAAADAHMQYLLSGQPGAAVDVNDSATFGSIYLVDTVDGSRQLLGRGWGARLSPDGTKILARRWDPDSGDPFHLNSLIVYSLDGDTLTQVADLGDIAADSEYGWSGDSSAVYYLQENQVATYDLAAGRITDQVAVNGTPVIDPADGSLWITSLAKNGIGPVFGHHVEESLSTPQIDRPSFSANGRFVTWLGYRTSGPTLDVLDLDTGSTAQQDLPTGDAPAGSPVLDEPSASGQQFVTYPVDDGHGGVAVRTVVQDATGAIQAVGPLGELVTGDQLLSDATPLAPTFLGGIVGPYSPPSVAQHDAFALPSHPGTVDYPVTLNDEGEVDGTTLTLQQPTDPGITVAGDRLEVVDDGTHPSLTANYRVCPGADYPTGSPSCSTATAVFSRPTQPTTGQLQLAVRLGNSEEVNYRADRDITVFPEFDPTGPYPAPASITALLPEGVTFRSMVPLADNTFGGCNSPDPGTVITTANRRITCTAVGSGNVPGSARWALTVHLSDDTATDQFGIGDLSPGANGNSYGLTVFKHRYAPPVLTLSAPTLPIHPGDQQSLTVQAATNANGAGFAPGALELHTDGYGDTSTALTAPGTKTVSFTAGNPGTERLTAGYLSLTPYLHAESDPQDAEITLPDGPDIATQLAHVGDLVQGGTGQLVVSARNGGGEDGTLGHLTVRLPPGITYTGVEGLDPGNAFTCTADPDGTTVDCDPHGETLAAGADLPRVGIDVAVAPDAAGGAASAHLSATGDVDTGNDTASDAITVTGATTGPDDPDLRVRVTSDQTPVAGEEFSLTVRVTNTGSGDYTGGLGLHALLDPQVSTGEPITITGGSSSRPRVTECAVTTIGLFQPSTLLDCVTAQGLAPGADITFTVTFAIPAGQVGATNALHYEVRDLDSTTVTAAGTYRLRVSRPLRAVLGATITGPSSISSYAQPFVVSVANSGRAATTQPVSVTVPVPHALAVTATDADTDWSCATGDAGYVCTYVGTVPPGGYAAPLELSVSSPSAGGTGVTLEADLASADDVGAVTGTAVLPLTVRPPQPSVLAVLRGSVAAGSYDLTVANSGLGTSHGQLRVVEALPAGVITHAVSATLDWTCAQTGTRLVCTSDKQVPSGQSSTAVHVTLSGGAAGTFTVSGSASDDFGSGLVDSQLLSLTTSTPGPPVVTTAASTAHDPLVRGEQDHATLQLRAAAHNAATGADLPVIAMVLPPGLTLSGALPGASPPQQAPDAGAAAAATSLTGAPVSLHCRSDAATGAVVCLDDA